MKLVVDPFRRNPLPKARRMNQLKAGVGRRFDPGLPLEARSPELDACRSRFEGFSHLVRSSGIQCTRSSASTAVKVALSSRRASRCRIRRR